MCEARQLRKMQSLVKFRILYGNFRQVGKFGFANFMGVIPIAL